MTPVRAWFGRQTFIEHAGASVAALREHDDEDERALLPHLENLNKAQREAISPVERIQHALHGWVAFGAMPLFALANAGVSMNDASLSGDSLFVFVGVGLGLVIGKPIGILAFSWLSTRLGLAALPRGVTWPQVMVVGVVAGIGFTMSIFIAALAFPAGANLETSKVSILAGSAIAAVLAYGLGRIVLPTTLLAGTAATSEEAEASTES
jgi:NhaA family Na+:H+ antiporter